MVRPSSPTSSVTDPSPDDVATVRSFNRAYTERIGALDDSFLGSGLPLGQARLVFEIGVVAEPTPVADLRARLALDSGYLSRLLRALEAAGLVAVGADPADGRRRRVALTRKGRSLRRKLDQRSDDDATRMLDPLSPRQRARLVDALAEAERLVRAATVHLELVGPDDPRADEALAAYVGELDRRFPGGFAMTDGEPLVHDGPFVVATSDGSVVACGGLHEIAPGVDEIKRMWVDAGWRGAGLGARLLRHLEALAADRGAQVVRLDTNGTLTEAIAMYERAGYHRIDRYNDNPYAEAFFEKPLRESPQGVASSTGG
jgi:DNA-binding MarR family transcriptional regulator